MHASNVDALLAKEMNSLSLDERERMFEDVHLYHDNLTNKRMLWNVLYIESTKEAITDSITRPPKINELIAIDHSELTLIYSDSTIRTR